MYESVEVFLVSIQMLRVLNCRDLFECRDVSKLRAVLEFCEDSEIHELTVCHKVFERLEVFLVSSQMLWGLRVS